MCGRTACTLALHSTLAPDDLCRACGYKTKDGKWRQPRWRDASGGQKYYTSYNIAPGSHTPILLSKQHFESTKEGRDLESEETMTECVIPEFELQCEWVIQPMQWGLVPFWQSRDTKSGYSMINARSDGMLTKRSFKVPLEKGCRCVVLVDGYFEWQQTSDGKKQPHFIYFPHATDQTVDRLNKDEQQGQETVYTGRRLLTLAGLFDVCKSGDGEPLYSYSIITVDSHKELAWMHHRMPAVLDGEADVSAWLDYGSVPLKKAVDLIYSRSSLHWHPVSTAVNNSKNKREECVKLIDLQLEKQKNEGGSSSLMTAWLKKGKKRTAEESVDKPLVQGEDKPLLQGEDKPPTHCDTKEDSTTSLEKKPKIEDDQ